MTTSEHIFFFHKNSNKDIAKRVVRMPHWAKYENLKI